MIIKIRAFFYSIKYYLEKQQRTRQLDPGCSNSGHRRYWGPDGLYQSQKSCTSCKTTSGGETQIKALFVIVHCQLFRFRIYK